ncbi:MAG TPA: NAD(P)-dependent oxidoreductase [Syntrophales bacterium]|nr:NAD(P)-dependent oxidoreductase [Syntrophales bacterium]
MRFSVYHVEKLPDGVADAIKVMNSYQTVFRLCMSDSSIIRPEASDPEDVTNALPKPEDCDAGDISFVIGVMLGFVRQNKRLSYINRKSQKALVTQFEWDAITMAAGDSTQPHSFWVMALTNICFQISINICDQINCIGYRDFTVKNLTSDILKLHLCDNCRDKLLEGRYKYHIEEILNLIDAIKKLAGNIIVTPAFKKPNLPILEKQIERQGLKKNRNIFETVGFIVIMHFLADLIPFIEGLLKLGAKKESIYILVKPYPYSQRTEVNSYFYNYHNEIHIEYLTELPPRDDLLFKIVADCALKSVSRHFIVIEDGGYVVPFLHRYFTDTGDVCIGAVEQTTKGIRLDEKIGDGRYKFPILDVAKSKFKDDYEAPLVGNAVVNSLQKLLPEERIAGKRTLVVGFGSVGREVANALRNNGAIVTIYDDKLSQIVSARTRSFEADIDRTTFKDQDIIIGTTGNTSIGEDVFKIIKTDTILVSSSSDRIEINIEELERIKSKDPMYKERLGTYYYMKVGGQPEKALLLLADGYPINFYSGSGIPNKAIDPILAQLFIGAVHIGEKYGSLAPAIHKSMDALIKDNHLYEDIYYSLTGDQSIYKTLDAV